MASHVVELFPGGVGVSGATVLSPGVLTRTDQFNSVQIEIIPQGPASGTFSVVDSGTEDTGFTATADSAGNVGTVTSYTKLRVTGVADFVRVQANVTSGSFRVRATLVNPPTQNTINAAISGTVNATVTGTVGQGAPNAGGAEAWPVVVAGSAAVTEADGANVTLGAEADAAVVTDAAGTISGKLRGMVKLLAAAVNLTYGWISNQPQPTTWNLTGTSAANTAQTVTQTAAGAGVRNYLSGLTVSWSGGAPAAGANIQVKDGSTVIWDCYIGQAGGTQGSNDFEFTQPLRGSANTALSIVVAAGGSGVTTKVSAQGTVGP